MRGARFVALLALTTMALAAAGLAPRATRARAVLWDLDGTLCDSFRLAFDATQTVLAARGHAAISEAEYHACTRYATPERMARHVGVLPGEPTYADVSRTLGAEFDALYISQVSAESAPLFTGAVETVLALHAAGVAQGLLTNAAVAYARAVLGAHGLGRCFALVHGADTVPAPKPRPEGLAQCLAELDALADAAAPDAHAAAADADDDDDDADDGAAAAVRAVYVGDSPSDGEAARAAGLASVGVGWGSHALATLARAGCFDALCASPAELRALLLPTAAADPHALRPRAALLLDRDGVLNRDVGHPGVLRPDALALLPTAAPALAALAAARVPTAVVTNQKAIGEGHATAAAVDAVHARLRALLAAADAGATLGPILLADGTAHGLPPKPAPALLAAALDALGAPPASALLVGDATTDAQAAAAAGVRFALVTSSAHGVAAAAALAAAGGAALPCGAPVGGGVWPHVGAAVGAELARLERATARAALARLARLSAAHARAGAVVAEPP